MSDQHYLHQNAQRIFACGDRNGFISPMSCCRVNGQNPGSPLSYQYAGNDHMAAERKHPTSFPKV